jgi:hypothetical protein
MEQVSSGAVPDFAHYALVNQGVNVVGDGVPCHFMSSGKVVSR